MPLSSEKIKTLVQSFLPFLSTEAIDQFTGLCQYEIHKSKDIILESGRTDKYVFLILSGSSRAYSLRENGQELNCHMRSEGYLFGDPRVFENCPQILTIEAIGETHILKFDIAKLESLGYKNAELMQLYIHFLKEIISAFSNRIHAFVSMSSEERYQDLLELNPLYLESTFDKHIASFLGVKPLTLHRIKKKLKIIK
ncbi:cyclic nucleotide-binding domain-containing protein [Mangrovimonas sp. AS39]|uniref:Crp/Fnr family transcriptional regulator n=1 Tax=Mangrovimonas futianensis TaxID=2895523 RepID=UPI001E4FE2C2|nr:cyclic nucleotide-binding domain-containing protein [Mangrovimonas futianensis]MCF1192446.1 cyclic nucleotide-binding domain-containing protein [Mangrovimonas futianensis]MCF1196224.1 cyclic nucleotide-binding domain-containing protein [Mangrovimonas futianensis]